MPITALTAHHVRIPLKRTIRHASHERTETDSLIVRCELNDGSVGWGEGLPREYVTGETIDDAWRLLQTARIVEQLDATLSNPDEAVIALSDLHFAESQISNLRSQISAEHLQRGCFGNSVRCAIEIAVLDAVCRSADVPLSHVTTLLPETEPIRQNAREVRYSGIITAERPLSQLHAALKQRVYGLRQIKVKVGVPGIDDFAQLRRIRRIVGRRVDLRIDANEAWNCETLADRLQPLTLAFLSCVEQPVPHEQVGELAAIREELPIPVMLDESLCSLRDAERAIDEGLCDLFNIRLSKCGGFLPSLRLAAMAHAAGLGSQLGCQVGETGILSAAGRHFATSVAGLHYLEGSYDRHLVRERLSMEDMTFGYGGVAPALRGPGLCVQLDERALRRLTVRSLDLHR
jgi:L-Ala-D/L-Glu epimerase